MMIPAASALKIATSMWRKLRRISGVKNVRAK